MKKRTKSLRAGNKFITIKDRMKLDLEMTTGKKFSDPEVTDFMATMLDYKRAYKIGKGKDGKTKIILL